MLEVVEDASPTAPVKTEQQFWGLRGVDDAILRRIDADGDGEYGASPDRHYHQLTDSSFSVVAHVDLNSGWELQWMSYDAYGNMKVLHTADFDGDGIVTYDPGDWVAFYAAYNSQQASADLNGDGQITSLDSSIFLDRFIDGYYSYGNFQEVRIAYAGYVHDPVMRTLLARNRWYDPVLGRWLTRDPAGYVDGMSLYLFVKGNPLGLVDPFGLEAWGPLDGWGYTVKTMLGFGDQKGATRQIWSETGKGAIKNPAAVVKGGYAVGKEVVVSGGLHLAPSTAISTCETLGPGSSCSMRRSAATVVLSTARGRSPVRWRGRFPGQHGNTESALLAVTLRRTGTHRGLLAGCCSGAQGRTWCRRWVEWPLMAPLLQPGQA